MKVGNVGIDLKGNCVFVPLTEILSVFGDVGGLVELEVSTIGGIRNIFFFHFLLHLQ